MAKSVDQPAFIIGGAPRSGTSFLCQALDRHPDVYMAKPLVPEPKVFMGPPQDPETYRARYAELFAGASGQRMLGEKTTNYLESQTCCERIAAYLPGVRMLFIVREPVARAYSNYLWSRKNGLETLTFEEAIALEGRRPSPLPPEKAHARPFDYLVRGDYATFAERYYEALGRDRVAFFLFEEIQARPDALLSRVQQFIGVEPLPAERLDVGVVNSARQEGPPIDGETERRLRARMAPLVDRFAALTGLDLRAWGYSTEPFSVGHEGGDSPSDRPRCLTL
jgi:hypothetical protein